MEYMESRMQDQIEGALHSQQEAMERIEQLQSDLATAEQDSRQKQARIERLEKAVKELREGLEIIAGYRQCADSLLSNLDVAREALKSTEDS